MKWASYQPSSAISSGWSGRDAVVSYHILLQVTSNLGPCSKLHDGSILKFPRNPIGCKKNSPINDAFHCDENVSSVINKIVKREPAGNVSLLRPQTTEPDVACVESSIGEKAMPVKPSGDRRLQPFWAF